MFCLHATPYSNNEEDIQPFQVLTDAITAHERVLIVGHLNLSHIDWEAKSA